MILRYHTSSFYFLVRYQSNMKITKLGLFVFGFFCRDGPGILMKIVLFFGHIFVSNIHLVFLCGDHVNLNMW